MIRFNSHIFIYCLNLAILAICDPIYVSRTNAESRKKTVELIKQRAYNPGKWPQTMIFPEGIKIFENDDLYLILTDNKVSV